MATSNSDPDPVKEEVQVPDENIVNCNDDTNGTSDKPDEDGNKDPTSTVSEKTDEEYDYLRRNLYTSEIFKIELRNLPKYYGFGELKKFLTNKLKLKLRKIKAPGNRTASRWTYICFDSKEEQLKAVELLNNYKWKNSVLQACIAKPAPDPLMKRKSEDQSDPSAKKPKILTIEDLEICVQRATIPWYNVPYSEQLDRITEDSKKLLNKFAYDVVKNNPSSKEYIDEMKKENDGLPCKFISCLGVDNCDYYRNKCECTIGFHAVTGEKTVGFRLGTYASGSVEVAPITRKLLHINKRMFEAVDCFQAYITNSDVDCYSPATNQGVWGTLTLKTGQDGQLMLIVGVHEINTPEELATKIKADLKEYFEIGEGKSLNVTSLYLQMITRRRSGADIPAPELLLGEICITQTLCGLNFSLSPLSFFQVNVPCMELMMKTIKEMVHLDNETTILDVCCGTGTLGLCLAKSCLDVIGVEREPQAIEDAKKNAENNNITNCSFFCGSADVILPSAVRHAKTKNIVALVDPPRAGLHKRAVKVIRRVESIKKIIYLSCDTRLAYSNFLDLCRAETKTMEGPPFHLKSTFAADMFPHTDRYEFVLYFEREESS